MAAPKGEPILVVRGRYSGWHACFGGLATLVAMIGAVLAFVAMLRSGLSPPWMPSSLVPILSLAAVAFLIAIVVVPVVVFGTVLRRTGSVAFHEEGIVFEAVPGVGYPALIPYWDVRGFSDLSADWIELVASVGLTPTTETRVYIPTPDEQARTAVLALLDHKGVRRLET